MNSDITINVYNINGYRKENIDLFYKQLELTFLDKNEKININKEEIMCELFTGKLGILQNATPTNKFYIYIRKSQLLETNITTILQQCNNTNKYIRIFFE